MPAIQAHHRSGQEGIDDGAHGPGWRFSAPAVSDKDIEYIAPAFLPESFFAKPHEKQFYCQARSTVSS
jgi:hypothetical protein